MSIPIAGVVVLASLTGDVGDKVLVMTLELEPEGRALVKVADIDSALISVVVQTEMVDTKFNWVGLMTVLKQYKNKKLLFSAYLSTWSTICTQKSSILHSILRRRKCTIPCTGFSILPNVPRRSFGPVILIP